MRVHSRCWFIFPAIIIFTYISPRVFINAAMLTALRPITQLLYKLTLRGECLPLVTLHCSAVCSDTAKQVITAGLTWLQNRNGCSHTTIVCLTSCVTPATEAITRIQGRWYGGGNSSNYICTLWLFVWPYVLIGELPHTFTCIDLTTNNIMLYWTSSDRWCLSGKDSVTD